MRLVQVTVPAGKREAVTSTLDADGVDYVLTDETSGREYTAIVSFPLPTGAVEPVLDDLREAGLERDSFTVVIDAETVVSRRFEKLQEEYEENEADTDRISRDELTARARDMAPALVTFVVMTLISTVVATAGLLVDSPAVVVGSMVIAPLIGPAMATSVGTVVDDEELFDRGVRLQVLGGVLAVAGAAAFAFVVRWSSIVPLTATEVFAIGEVRERLSPDVLSLAVALGAGVAGALSLSTGVSSALVGVMIAAALVPPTAVVGIGIAWGRPTAVVGSAILVLVNFVGINLAALAVLWWQGYRPERWFKLDEARAATAKRIAILAVGLLLLSSMLAGVTYSAYRTATFEEDARAAVSAEIEESDTRLQLLSMTVQYEDFPIRRPTQIVVTVGHPLESDPPPLADRLRERVRATARPPPLPPLPFETNGDVEVDVRYVALDEAADG
ncbi:TIGR00341 family protein [Salinigranum sp. GCM10025319]|uniref:TIGR00341 family protein n=1 Tax=Salinigranum sp. GCM10025319 TaxID=3252687 RepID=UPI003615A7B5